MIKKVEPVQLRGHPDFPSFLEKLQTDRILSGKETGKTKIAQWRLTKTIMNFFMANESLYKKLVEVEIKRDGI